MAKHRKILRGNIAGLTDSAIKKLAHKAGIKSLSSTIYEEVRGLSKMFMENIIEDAILYMESSQRVKLSVEDVLMSIEKHYKKVYTTDHEDELKRCPSFTAKQSSKKRERGTQSIRMIKFYQDQSDCVYFAKASFDRLFHEVCQDFKVDLQVSKKAVGVLHTVTEAYLVELFEAANLCAIHADRSIVKPKDIELVRYIRGDK